MKRSLAFERPERETMRKRFQAGLVVVAFLSAVGCTKHSSAVEVCHKLEGAGVATGCHGIPPTGVGAGAAETAQFELTEMPEHEGTVYRFEDGAAYDKTAAALDAATRTGPHPFGSRKALIFVQLNSNTPSDIAAHVRTLVEAL